MSLNNSQNGGTFVRAFLPGLIVGLVVGGFAGASGVDGTAGSRGGGVVGPGAPGGGGEVDEQARTPNASSSGRTQ